MTVDELRASLAAPAPPAPAGGLLEALWRDGRGEWDAAHRIAQAHDGADAAWVHAYLHRKEGDPSNAAYWYRRAGREVAADSLDAEWSRIAEALLAVR